MPRRVFLSFVEEDLQLVRMFRGQAVNRNTELAFSDHSVQVPYNSSNADYIRRQIREKINHASVTLCLIGETTHTSTWVEWEIQTAQQLGKGLLGVRLHSSHRDIVPQVLSSSRATIVDWNIPTIVNAIENVARNAGF